MATRKATTRNTGKMVAQADEENVSTEVMDPRSSFELSGVGRKGRRKVSSKMATTCIGEAVAQEQEDVSEGVDQPSSATFSGVAIGHQSQVHIEHVKQSLKVVTTLL